MREILFRGKTIYNPRWFEGYYAFDWRHWIECKSIEHPECVCEAYPINPETLGQFTGLTDKNGVKIFEGDIVKHYNNSPNGYDIGRIYWSDKTLSFRRTSSLPNSQFDIQYYALDSRCEYEVIGNIYDNPELLEVGKA